MRIEKEVVEKAINTEEDLIIAVDTVVFKKSVKCRNIVSENCKRNINAVDINAWNIKAGDINAWNIKAGDINAGDIKAGDINAGDINARDINAGNINAGNIKAGDINAVDIKAGDINAGFIVCETRKKKTITAKTVCYNLIEKRSTFDKEEKGRQVKKND